MCLYVLHLKVRIGILQYIQYDILSIGYTRTGLRGIIKEIKNRAGLAEVGGKKEDEEGIFGRLWKEN